LIIPGIKQYSDGSRITKIFRIKIRARAFERISIYDLIRPTATQSNRFLLAVMKSSRCTPAAVDELSILNDLARSIGASVNAEEIMQIIIRRSLRAVNAEQGVITLVEDEQKTTKTLIRTMVSSADAPAFHLHQHCLAGCT